MSVKKVRFNYEWDDWMGTDLINFAADGRYELDEDKYNEVVSVLSKYREIQKLLQNLPVIKTKEELEKEKVYAGYVQEADEIMSMLSE
jgi:hypothetical protein